MRFMTRAAVSSECVHNMFPQSAHLSAAGPLFGQAARAVAGLHAFIMRPGQRGLAHST